MSPALLCPQPSCVPSPLLPAFLAAHHTASVWRGCWWPPGHGLALPRGWGSVHPSSSPLTWDVRQLPCPQPEVPSRPRSRFLRFCVAVPTMYLDPMIYLASSRTPGAATAEGAVGAPAPLQSTGALTPRLHLGTGGFCFLGRRGETKPPPALRADLCTPTFPWLRRALWVPRAEPGSS